MSSATAKSVSPSSGRVRQPRTIQRVAAKQSHFMVHSEKVYQLQENCGVLRGQRLPGLGDDLISVGTK